MTIGKIVLDNFKLTRFYGEGFYDNSSDLLLERDCEFTVSPQSCWNPNGNGRVVAHNVQAGISRQVAEIIGGAGHVYLGGRFYRCGNGGIAVVGGPDGTFGSPYNTPVRRTDAPPPYIEFQGTRFEEMANGLYLGCWVRGNIICTDAGAVLSNAFAVSGHIHDVDLDIVTTTDWSLGNNITPVLVDGPATFAGDQLTNINLRVRAGRTDYSQGAGNSSFSNALYLSGAIDPATCTFKVEGYAQKAWQAAPTTLAAMPLVNDAGFVGYGPEVLSFNGDFTWTVTSPKVLLLSNAASAGTALATMDTTHSFSDGQRIRFTYATGGSPTKIVKFAVGGAGLKLAVDRELKNIGDFIELEYNAYAGLWSEANWVGT